MPAKMTFHCVANDTEIASKQLLPPADVKRVSSTKSWHPVSSTKWNASSTTMKRVSSAKPLLRLPSFKRISSSKSRSMESESVQEESRIQEDNIGREEEDDLLRAPAPMQRERSKQRAGAMAKLLGLHTATSKSTDQSEDCIKASVANQDEAESEEPVPTAEMKEAVGVPKEESVKVEMTELDSKDESLSKTDSNCGILEHESKADKEEVSLKVLGCCTISSPIKI